MSDMHLEVLRENAAAAGNVPFPRAGESLYGGVYRQIQLDLREVTTNGPVYIDYVIVLEGGCVVGDARGTLYVPEGVVVDTTDSPDLEVKQLSGEDLATVYREASQ